jgi:ribosomal protein S27AE
MTMKNLAQEHICPNCGSAKMKNWRDLSDEQKFLVERLPLSAEYTAEERKKHRFCERCFYEDVRLSAANS